MLRFGLLVLLVVSHLNAISLAPDQMAWFASPIHQDTDADLEAGFLIVPATNQSGIDYVEPDAIPLTIIWSLYTREALDALTQRADRYRFYQIAEDGTETVIAETINDRDEISVEWNVPDGFVGTLRAEAYDGETLIAVVSRDVSIRIVPTEGYLDMPYLFADAGMVSIEAGATLPVTWEDYPAGAERYAVFANQRVLIGEDSDASDGVQVQWNVPEDFSGSLWGEAYDQNGTLVGVAFSPPDVGAAVIPPTPSIAELFVGEPPAQECIGANLSPFGDATIYGTLSFDDDGIGILPHGLGTVVVGRAERPPDGLGFYQITLENVQLNEGVTAELGWVLDRLISVYPPCSNIPLLRGSDSVPIQGYLSIDNLMEIPEDELGFAEPEATYTVRWDLPPALQDTLLQTDATYSFFQVSEDETQTLIGEDADASDGVETEWTAPTGFVGRLLVEAYDQDGEIIAVAYSQVTLEVIPIRGSLEMPYLYADGSMAVVEEGATIPVTWVDYPEDADRYLFSTTWGIYVGDDRDNSDGVQVEWTVPENFYGTLRAEAYRGPTLVGVAFSVAGLASE